MKNKIVILLIIFFSVLRCFDCYCQSEINTIKKEAGIDNYYDYGKNGELDCPFVSTTTNNIPDQHYQVTNEAKVGFWASTANSITLKPGFEASGFVGGSFIAWFDDAENYISNGICNGSIVDIKDDDIDANKLTSKTYESCWECLPNGKEINEHKAERVEFTEIKATDINGATYISVDHGSYTSYNSIEINGEGYTIGNSKAYVYLYNTDDSGNKTDYHIINEFANLNLSKGIYFNTDSLVDKKNIIDITGFPYVIIKKLNIKIKPNVNEIIVDGHTFNDEYIDKYINIYNSNKEVKIEECYFEGEGTGATIKISNSNDLFINKVELAGAYGHSSVNDKFYFYCGGIYINQTGSYLTARRIIQNCYFHDNTRPDGASNGADYPQYTTQHDALLMEIILKARY